MTTRLVFCVLATQSSTKFDLCIIREFRRCCGDGAVITVRELVAAVKFVSGHTSAPSLISFPAQQHTLLLFPLT